MPPLNKDKVRGLIAPTSHPHSEAMKPSSLHLSSGNSNVRLPVQWSLLLREIRSCRDPVSCVAHSFVSWETHSVLSDVATNELTGSVFKSHAASRLRMRLGPGVPRQALSMPVQRVRIRTSSPTLGVIFFSLKFYCISPQIPPSSARPKSWLFLILIHKRSSFSATSSHLPPSSVPKIIALSSHRGRTLPSGCERDKGS